MTALLINNEVREGIEAVKQYADKHRITAEMVKSKFCAGDHAGYSVILPNGYRVVYCIEDRDRKWYRHISVSITKPSGYPNHEAFDEITGLFGFTTKTSPRKKRRWMPGVIWVESAVRAVNLAEPISK